LSQRLVELGHVESVSHETVRQTLKNGLKPWRKDCWVIPPEQDADFICQMEEVLGDCHQREYQLDRTDEDIPL
jgi:hypothetical protein